MSGRPLMRSGLAFTESTQAQITLHATNGQPSMAGSASNNLRCPTSFRGLVGKGCGGFAELPVDMEPCADPISRARVVVTVSAFSWKCLPSLHVGWAFPNAFRPNNMRPHSQTAVNPIRHTSLSQQSLFDLTSKLQPTCWCSCCDSFWFFSTRIIESCFKLGFSLFRLVKHLILGFVGFLFFSYILELNLVYESAQGIEEHVSVSNFDQDLIVIKESR